MTSRIDAAIAAQGLELPPPSSPAYNYQAVVRHAGILYVSGQIPKNGNDPLYTGKVGAEVDLESAREAARLCALNALSQLKAALSSLDAVERILKVTGFVASAPGFHGQPLVVDAASDLLVDVFGDSGRHTRSAIGVAELPRGVPVEIEMIAAATNDS